jgi:hypothetical protein
MFDFTSGGPFHPADDKHGKQFFRRPCPAIRHKTPIDVDHRVIYPLPQYAFDFKGQPDPVEKTE